MTQSGHHVCGSYLPTPDITKRESSASALIRRMSIENPLWGAPRIHGELLKLGFERRSRAINSHAILGGLHHHYVRV
jgi:hypothetical protein